MNSNKLSEETRKKITETCRKNSNDPERVATRAKATKIAAEKRRGTHLPEEHRKNISRALIGKTYKRDKSQHLNSAQIIQIKKLAKEGKSRFEIANMFGIKYQAVANIENGKTWAHVKLKD
jgi:hypothetical protein